MPDKAVEFWGFQALKLDGNVILDCIFMSCVFYL